MEKLIQRLDEAIEREEIDEKEARQILRDYEFELLNNPRDE